MPVHSRRYNDVLRAAQFRMPTGSQGSSLSELLVSRTVSDGSPPQRVSCCGDSGELTHHSVTLTELDDRARRIAAYFGMYAERGARALLAIPPGPDFLACFFGCLYASIIAVPVPDWRGSRGRARVEDIARECSATWLITSTSAPASSKALAIRAVTLEELLASDVRRDPDPHSEDDLAYLQFTSGSTSRPRGVMVSHGNVMANLEALDRVMGRPRGGWAVSWLPFYHDMGLIKALFALHTGMSLAIETPDRFIQRPWRWLQAISAVRACYSGGPNFAYELLNRAAPPAHSEPLDLSCWTMAYCGAELVRPRTLRRFARRFAAQGFQAHAFAPGYGLAEFTLAATMVPAHRSPEFRSYTPLAAGPQEQRARELSECGEPVDGHVARIVDPESLHPLPDGAVGEVWLKGRSKTLGYWGRPEETAATFNASLGDDHGYLRTGDLGFIDGGRVFIVGRLKEIVIVRGRNLHPTEIEETVIAAHPALDGAAAAFVLDRDDGEGLGVVCEVRRTSLRQLPTREILHAMQRELVGRFGVRADEVALVKPGVVPRTTSGKVQRLLCRQMLERGELDTLARWTLWTDNAALAQSDRSTEPPDRRAISNWIVGWLQTHLRIDPDDVDPRVQLSSFGLDSLHAVELTYALEDWLGITLDQTITWRQPSLQDLSRTIESLARHAEPAANSDRRLSAVESVLAQIESLNESDVDALFVSRVVERISDHGRLPVSNSRHVQEAADAVGVGSQRAPGAKGPRP